MKIKMFLAMFISAAALFFCTAQEAKEQKTESHKPGTPAYTVVAYYRAMANADLAAAKKLVGPEELQKMITMLEDFVKEMPEFVDEIKSEYAPVYKSLKIRSQKIEGNTAVVEISLLNTETGKVVNSKHGLKKVKGVWVLEE